MELNSFFGELIPFPKGMASGTISSDIHFQKGGYLFVGSNCNCISITATAQNGCNDLLMGPDQLLQVYLIQCDPTINFAGAKM